MNPALINLLSLTPGLGNTQRNKNMIHRESVSFGDWEKLLSAKDPHWNRELRLNQWVTVKAGAYKGDTGYVASLRTGGAVVLLVPRIPPPIRKQLKRKRSDPQPPAALFDLATIRKTYDQYPQNRLPAPIPGKPHTFKFLRSVYQHGLLRQYISARSLNASIVSMTAHDLHTFRRSGHPSVLAAKFPRPIDWKFKPGEPVLSNSSRSEGHLSQLWVDGAEVEMGEQGLVYIPWHDLRKSFKSGDYAVVVGGPHATKQGWVIEVDTEHWLASMIQVVGNICLADSKVCPFHYSIY